MLAPAMQEGMLKGRAVAGEGSSAAADSPEVPARARSRMRVPSRGGLAIRLLLGILPSSLMVAAMACIDHFVAPVAVVAAAAPLMVAVVIGAFLGGTRAGVAAVLPGAGYLAVHYSNQVWPLEYTTQGAEGILTFIPCGIAAALI